MTGMRKIPEFTAKINAQPT